MNSRLRKRIITDAAWLGGAALFCIAVVGGAIRVLETSKAEVHDLRASLVAKERRIATELAATREAAALAAVREELAATRRAVASDSERVAHLSDVAAESGVELVRIQSGVSRLSEDGRVVAKTHRLSVTGGYRELAAFLDGIYAAAGVVGIDQLEIRPDTGAETEVAPRVDATHAAGRLRASLEVAWFGQVLSGAEG